jgi:hypothetical protein
MGLGHQVCHDKVTDWRPQVFSRPRTDAQRVRPMRGVGSLDNEAIQTGDGFVPCFGDYQQNPRNSRRNALPTERIDGPLLMRHEHLTCTFRELRQITHTPSRSESVFHRPPETFDGLEVVPTVGRYAREAQRAVGGVEGRVERVRPMDPAPIDDPHDFLPGCAEGRHHLMEILAQLLGIQGRDDLREDARGPRRHGTNDVAPHATGDPAPRARADPRLTFARRFTSDVTLAEWTRGEARALGAALCPAGAGQSARGSFHLHRAKCSRHGGPGTRGRRGRGSQRRGPRGSDRVVRWGGRR